MVAVDRRPARRVAREAELRRRKAEKKARLGAPVVPPSSSPRAEVTPHRRTRRSVSQTVEREIVKDRLTSALSPGMESILDAALAMNVTNAALEGARRQKRMRAALEDILKRRQAGEVIAREDEAVQFLRDNPDDVAALLESVGPFRPLQERP